MWHGPDLRFQVLSYEYHWALADGSTIFFDRSVSMRMMFRRIVVQKRAHPAVPHVKKRSKIAAHVGVVIVMVRDIVEAFEQPMLRHPGGDHFMSCVASNVDHGIVRQVGKQYDWLHRNENNYQTEAEEL